MILLSTFSILVSLHELLGTPGNLELRSLERRGTARLAFIIIGLTGLMGDIDAGHMCCCNHFCLLTMSATLSPSLSIPFESQRLLGTPGVQNWEWLDRRVAGRLVSIALLTVGHSVGL